MIPSYQYSDELFQITQRIFILGYYTFSWTLMFRNTCIHSSTGFAHLSSTVTVQYSCIKTERSTHVIPNVIQNNFLLSTRQ